MNRKSKKDRQIRIDEHLHDVFGFSLEKARKLLMAGHVRAKSQIIDKPGTKIKASIIPEIVGMKAYVSRAGYKIEEAWKHMGFEVTEKNALDIGISTGGFSDFLLQNGIGSILGVDVAYGILDLKIRQHPKVSILEKTNARQLSEEQLTSYPVFDLVVMDVSFISIFAILPNLMALQKSKRLSADCDFIIMVKPQFEIEKEKVPKGGILTQELREACLANVEKSMDSIGMHIHGSTDAGLRGKKGNLERFYWLKSTS